jgi:hypothetical protein
MRSWLQRIAPHRAISRAAPADFVSLIDTCGVAFAGALDAMENTRPFYTDASMKTLKPMPEFKVPFMAMPQTKREMMMRECQDATMSKPYAEFCADENALAGS